MRVHIFHRFTSSPAAQWLARRWGSSFRCGGKTITDRKDGGIVHLNRRAFVASVALAGTYAAPIRVLAQRARALPRVALVFNNGPLAEISGPDPVDNHAREFVYALRELGYVEGRTIIIERRSAEGRQERMPVLLQELVRLPVDVIVVMGRGTRDAQRATATIPIVALVDDPEETGLVASLARPGGNITGQAGSAGPTIHGKRVQLLKEAIPQIVRIALMDAKYVDDKATPGVKLRRGATEDAARALGVTIIPVGVGNAEDFEQAFKDITRHHAEALIVVGTNVTHEHQRRIIEFTTRERLPSICDDREWCELGGLLGYGSNIADLMHRVGAYVDKILKGTKPADLPFGRPTNFELTINLKTARALGLTIPQTLLLRADKVIQ